MSRPSFGRRFWRSLTGQPTGAETCRPVTVTGDDGQPVHTTVLGAQPMSEEGQAALGEIVHAAQRKHAADLRAARQAADDDVRAVAALLDSADRAAKHLCERWATADAVRARFADRIAALERDAETETAVHGLLADHGQRARDAKAGDQ